MMTLRREFARPKPIDHQIAQLRDMALSTFEASSCVIYWISSDNRMIVADAFGPCILHFQRYIREMKAYDPLNVERLISSEKRIATISNDRGLAPVGEFERYSGYMEDSGFRDVIDFVFWQDKRPFAGLGILKTPDEPPIGSETLRIAQSVQPYLEYNLAQHPRQRQHERRRRLRAVYGLTMREIEIADLIRIGLTNQDIADELGIGLGTVKTHLLKIFQKLDVSNRVMLTMRIAVADDADCASNQTEPTLQTSLRV